LRALCSRILRDERWHVRFQCDRLAQMRAGRRAPLFMVTRWAERLGFRAVCVAVWLNHASVFRAGGTGFRAFWQKSGRELETAWRLIRSANRLDCRHPQDRVSSCAAEPARPGEWIAAKIPAPSSR
jgi:hypothetical protein